MRKILFICVLFLLIFKTGLRAQEIEQNVIKGKVVDDRQTVVGGASITLKKARDSTIYKIAMTDSAGIFRFADVKAGSYLVEIKVVGYEKIIVPAIRIGEDQPVADLGVALLQKQVKVLDETVVKAKPPLIERKLDKTVVNVESSVLSDGSTALQMLGKLPGIQVTGDGQISLNGKNDVTVFIDGKQTYLSGADLVALLRTMPSVDIQKVEIMTNPSAKYDAAGNGGIINIVKKRNHLEGLNGSISGSLGHDKYSKDNGSFNLSYKEKNYNLFFNFAYSYYKELFIMNTVGYIYNPDNSFNNLQVINNARIFKTVGYTPSVGADINLSKKTTLSLSAITRFQNVDNRTNAYLTQYDSVKNEQGRSDFTNIFKDKPFSVSPGMHLTHQINTKGEEISFDLDYSRYWNNSGQNINNYLYDVSGNYLGDSASLLNQKRNLSIYSAKADYTRPLSGNARLDLGWKTSYVRTTYDDRQYDQAGGEFSLDSSNSDYYTTSENINAGYINASKEFKKLTAQVGLRGEQTNYTGEQTYAGHFLPQSEIRKNYFQLFPSAFFEFKINKNNKLNLKTGRRVQRPAYSRLNPFRRPISSTIYFQGNPNLNPQTAFNTELTYSYKNSLFVTLGYTYYKDLIWTMPFLDSDNVTTTRTPINLPGSHYYNLNIVYSKNLTPWWSTNSNLLFYRQTYNGSLNGFDVNTSGKLSYSFDFDNTFNITKKLSAEGDFKYWSSNQLVTIINERYYILSFGAKQQLFGGKGSISVNYNNVLQSESSGYSERYKDAIEYYYLYFYSTTFSVSFSYRFGKNKVAKLKAGSGSQDEQKRTNPNAN